MHPAASTNDAAPSTNSPDITSAICVLGTEKTHWSERVFVALAPHRKWPKVSQSARLEKLAQLSLMFVFPLRLDCIFMLGINKLFVVRYSMLHSQNGVIRWVQVGLDRVFHTI